MANSTSLKSDAVLEQMKLHLATDAGKQLTKKIGLVYQINIAPKVPLSLSLPLFPCVYTYFYPNPNVILLLPDRRKLDSTRKYTLLISRKGKLPKVRVSDLSIGLIIILFNLRVPFFPLLIFYYNSYETLKGRILHLLSTSRN